MLIPFLNRFLHWLIIGIVSPILSLLILSKGVTIEFLGVVLGVTSFVIIILEVPSGFLSDYLGRKKIYLISIIIFLIGFTILYYANSFIFVAIGFSLYGISRAFSSGSVESIFINNFRRNNDDKKLHKLMTSMGAGETLGLAIGSVIGGFIPNWWSNFFADVNYYNGNVVVSILILLILFVITIFTINEEKVNNEKTIKNYIYDTFSGLGSNRTLKMLLVGLFIWGLSINAIELYWQPFLKSLGTDGNTDTWILGVTNSGFFISSLIGTLLISIIINKTKLTTISMLLMIRVVMGISIILLSRQQSISGFIAIYWLLFLFNGASNIPENTIYNIHSTDANRSSFLSIASLATHIGGVVGAFVYSVLIGRLEIGTILVIAGAIMIVSLIPYFLIIKYNKHDRDKFDRDITTTWS